MRMAFMHKLSERHFIRSKQLEYLLVSPTMGRLPKVIDANFYPGQIIEEITKKCRLCST